MLYYRRLVGFPSLREPIFGASREFNYIEAGSRSPLLVPFTVVLKSVTVSFQIPNLLQQYCRNRGQLDLSAKNVSEALKEVKNRFPDLYVNICDETGRVRQHINLFINEALVDKSSLDNAKLKPGDELLVFTAVSGG